MHRFETVFRVNFKVKTQPLKPNGQHETLEYSTNGNHLTLNEKVLFGHNHLDTTSIFKLFKARDLLVFNCLLSLFLYKQYLIVFKNQFFGHQSIK